jgi:hypothetical protein
MLMYSFQLNETKEQSNKTRYARTIRYINLTLMEITIIKTTYAQHIVQFKFQSDVLYKPITYTSEDILPVTGFEAVKSS